jgi:hypothetical protein
MAHDLPARQPGSGLPAAARDAATRAGRSRSRVAGGLRRGPGGARRPGVAMPAPVFMGYMRMLSLAWSMMALMLEVSLMRSASGVLVGRSVVGAVPWRPACGLRRVWRVPSMAARSLRLRSRGLGAGLGRSGHCDAAGSGLLRLHRPGPGPVSVSPVRAATSGTPGVPRPRRQAGARGPGWGLQRPISPRCVWHDA